MSIHEIHHLKELYRFAELGRMSAALLHDISHPLSAALINLETADSSSPSIKRARYNMQALKYYIEAARQQFHGHDSSSTFAVKAQLKHVKEVTLPLARVAGVSLDFACADSSWRIKGNRLKFQRIVINLVVNAIQAYDNGNRQKTKTVKVTVAAQDNWLIIKVKDRGLGIPPDCLDDIFSLFYTTKEPGGSGMGLSITKRYVTEDFGGTIAVSSSKRQGTCFILSLKMAVSIKNLT